MYFVLCTFIDAHLDLFLCYQPRLDGERYKPSFRFFVKFDETIGQALWINSLLMIFLDRKLRLISKHI